MKVKPNPYIITFAPEVGDNGPAHLAFILRTYYVKFKHEGDVVGEGEIHSVEYDQVFFYEYCACCEQKKSVLRVLEMGTDFDEIEYQ